MVSDRHKESDFPRPNEGEGRGRGENARWKKGQQILYRSQRSVSFSLSSPLRTVLLLVLLLSSPLLLVDVLAADDLVNDPVENVKNEEDEWEGHAGYRVDALGPTNEQLLHLLDALFGCGRGRGIVVVAFDGHAVLSLQASGAHAVTGETEAALARLILLQHRPRLRLLGTRERRYC